ncbi:hypothetical protein J8L88_16480 [Aquimarina sp. MMG015]|uniref:hypothetical protein n=1 Tax=Aquimarina sp. MMG015 TaxID=2822689 RepID=UPI001B3A328C|nr:hypothetical protein [Aquimarina sp. MMG015]MBQ4804459.1 hypothetical protein [Aquimarina sp. MMG015]
MKSIFILLILFTSLNSCYKKKYYNNKTSEVISISSYDAPNFDSFSISLPVGNILILTDFPEVISFDNKKLSSTLDSISNHFDKISSTKESKCLTSNIPIEYPYYEIKELLEDSKSVSFEHILKLPQKKGLDISIEKVSKKCNDNSNLEIQYCLVIKKQNKLIKLYNIGYTLFGDLTETSKYWFIDNNYIINTRTVSSVSGNDEYYVHMLNKFTLNDEGTLINYFEKSDGSYENKYEKGLIKDHLKHGSWVEKKPNYGYVNSETYVEAKYSNGIPVKKWYYYMLETIEEVNDEGYVINTITKKTDKLLMTEEYSDKGVLLKREIIGNK